MDNKEDNGKAGYCKLPKLPCSPHQRYKEKQAKHKPSIQEVKPIAKAMLSAPVSAPSYNKQGQTFRAGNPGQLPGRKLRWSKGLVSLVLSLADELEAEGLGLSMLARKHPAWYYEKFIAPLLPRQLDIRQEVWTRSLSDDELEERIRKLEAQLGRGNALDTSIIEVQPEDTGEDTP